jgi:beta-phosphoglucomutase-like phosphatase (HAD superfamily)
MDLLVERLGIRDHFGAVISTEAVPGDKPDPALLLELAHVLRVEPRRSVVVDATPEGVEAARRAGMASLAVASIRPRDVLRAADLVVQAMSDPSVETFDRLVEDHGETDERD